MQNKAIKPHCLALLSVAALLSSTAPVASAAGSNGPELQLFSSTIVEDIRRTGEAAAEMENGVLGSIEMMDKQLELYKASDCESAGEDSGCAEMRRQLGQSYGTMLDAMDAVLPEMQAAITRTRDGLQKNLVSQIGRSMSPTSLQELMLDQGGPAAKADRPARSSKNRLSERFNQYYSLVAGSSGGAKRGRGALAVTAADIYLDMQDASELISLTRDEISRSQIFIDIDQAMPGMTEQMEVTVAGVKNILFGDESEQGLTGIEPPPVAASNNSTAPNGDFASPLEL